MAELLKREREFVIPGEPIVESMNYLPGKNCFREGNCIYSKIIGLVHISDRVISVIPLVGVYIPRVGDIVIGEIIDIQSSGWVVDIKSPYQAYLSLAEGVKDFIDILKTDLSKFYDIGDLIYAKIAFITKSKSVYLSMKDVRAKKFKGGRIISINSTKVPRLIGKAGSMINLIKSKTNCKIVIGQNGLIWLQGEKEEKAIKAIKTIEKESQIDGLTDKIEKLLEEGD